MLTDGTAAKRGAAETRAGKKTENNQMKTIAALHPNLIPCFINHPFAKDDNDWLTNDGKNDAFEKNQATAA